MQNVWHQNKSNEKDGWKYSSMLNHQEVEYDYQVSSYSCEYQINDFWNYFQTSWYNILRQCNLITYKIL
jgi:hypothetical protein